MLQAMLYTSAGILLTILVGYLISAPIYKGPKSDHFNGKRFFNPGGVKLKGFADVFKWLLTRKRKPWAKITETQYGPKPEEKIDSGIRITFVNHTTFLIQVDGLNLLTDPIWSKRASPFAWAGPKRMRPPGIKLQDLPPIDIVLLSHNHYDHCDIPTLQKIYEMFEPKTFTGVGVEPFLRKHGIRNIIEMDWWEDYLLTASVQLQSIPAQHFSGRGMFDGNATLWMGFVIKTKTGNILFAGDTAYNESMFKEIGERCSPVVLSIIPIGAYEPRWFMSPVHCSPEEAVRIHLDVCSKQSIGSHFGTFPLADEGGDQPIHDLRKALKDLNLPEEVFTVIKEGNWKQF